MAPNTPILERTPESKGVKPSGLSPYASLTQICSGAVPIFTRKAVKIRIAAHTGAETAEALKAGIRFVPAGRSLIPASIEYPPIELITR